MFRVQQKGTLPLFRVEAYVRRAWWWVLLNALRGILTTTPTEWDYEWRQVTQYYCNYGDCGYENIPVFSTHWAACAWIEAEERSYADAKAHAKAQWRDAKSLC